MSQDPDDLVILTECANNIEASLLRGALQSSGLFCHVQGENHRSIVPIGSFVALNLMVKRRDVETARALVADHRRAAAEALGDDEEDDDKSAASKLPKARALTSEPRSNKSTARLLAIFPAFGMGHHYAKAHLRGLFLGFLQVCGVSALVNGGRGLGIGLLAFAILTDVALVGPWIDIRLRQSRG